MDFGDREEVALKAKASGKDPDQPFDEAGRDVFEGYSFNGIFPAAFERGKAGSSKHLSENEEGDIEDEDEAIEEATGSVRSQTMSSDSQRCNSLLSDSGIETQQIHTDLASNSGSDDHAVTQDDPAFSCTTKSVVTDSGSLQPSTLPLLKEGSLPEPSQVNSEAQAIPEQHSSPQNIKKIHTFMDMSRKSIEQSRPVLDLSVAAPKDSEDGDDWDVVETMEKDEAAANGFENGRRQLLAGPTLVARGIIDKYRMQIKPNSRAATSTPPHTWKGGLGALGRGSREGSLANLSRLSPSTSIHAATSNASLVKDSPTSTRQDRHKTLKYVRASTEWLSGGLPISPSSRFRYKRSKQALTPGKTSGVSENTERDKGNTAPLSADSASTLPIEASSSTLPPLIRQTTRNEYDANEAENEDLSKCQEGDKEDTQ